MHAAGQRGAVAVEVAPGGQHAAALHGAVCVQLVVAPSAEATGEGPVLNADHVGHLVTTFAQPFHARGQGLSDAAAGTVVGAAEGLELRRRATDGLPIELLQHLGIHPQHLALPLLNWEARAASHGGHHVEQLALACHGLGDGPLELPLHVLRRIGIEDLKIKAGQLPEAAAQRADDCGAAPSELDVHIAEGLVAARHKAKVASEL
mmetsp:Transcript_17295/g.49114  ORF Transcript_17295/g.49114 Transcript_17295/m.49114 type:complete len:206 (+) Transcript_17295:1755-2372(+)